MSRSKVIMVKFCSEWLEMERKKKIRKVLGFRIWCIVIYHFVFLLFFSKHHFTLFDSHPKQKVPWPVLQWPYGCSSKYKYLGLYFNDHMDESDFVNEVAKSATRALRSIISKYKRTGGNLYETVTNSMNHVSSLLYYMVQVYGV